MNILFVHHVKSQNKQKCFTFAEVLKGLIAGLIARLCGQGKTKRSPELCMARECTETMLECIQRCVYLLSAYKKKDQKQPSAYR